MYRKFMKPALDSFLALVGILILFPVFLLVTVILFFSNQGKPFFFQTRPGQGEKLFKVIKFKTMNDRKDEKGNLLPDEQRMTTVGKFIRKISLDEIPQLLNILKGEMSLVGPRPLLPEYLPLYNKEQRKRHQVKPGITGWAQVNGRNAISWEEKFKYDVWYVEHKSFTLDLKILLMTIKKVFKSEGISAEGHVSIEKFKGAEHGA